MRVWIGCLLLFAAAGAKEPNKKGGACDGVASTGDPKWCIKPPPGYELDPASKPDKQIFREKATNQAFDVSWYAKPGGVEGALKQMRSDVPAEGGKDLKEEAVPGGKLFRYKAAYGPTVVMVMAGAGPGAKPGTERVVTCRVNLVETNAEFPKQLAACKTLRVLP